MQKCNKMKKKSDSPIKDQSIFMNIMLEIRLVIFQ